MVNARRREASESDRQAPTTQGTYDMSNDTLTIDDVRNRATIDVPTAGRLLGVSRDHAYRAAQSGELPTLKMGARILVPVPALLRQLGHDTEAAA